jgi:rhodanese-related sulfurtransferase
MFIFLVDNDIFELHQERQMNTTNSATAIIIGLLLYAGTARGADLQLLSPTDLQTMITQETFESDMILIDVRDDVEVADGVIASEYCHPYHMSWNMSVLQENYSLLPTDIKIVVYCRSGSRSGQAGKFLIQNGFEDVASMSGGIFGYPGELMDASVVKPMSALPEPSYVAPVTVLRRQKSVRMPTSIKTEGLPQKYFTLNGKTVGRSTLRQLAPAVFLLEESGSGTEGAVAGFRHTVITGK